MGRAAAVDGVVEKVLGKPARTMHAFLTEYANEFCRASGKSLREMVGATGVSRGAASGVIVSDF